MDRARAERYAERIGIAVPEMPTAKALAELQEAHLLAVPFENLDIHAGRRIELTEDALFDKIVTRRRGGFCYELNGLFLEFLRALRFSAHRVSARVYGSEGLSPEYDHMALLVDCEGRWLVDVGFGDAFVRPLAIDASDFVRQRTTDHRISFTHEGLVYASREETEWVDQYRFTLEPRAWSEFEERCVFHQTSPDSHFTQKRVVTRLTTSGRVTLRDDRLIVTTADGVEERPIEDAVAWTSQLDAHFAIASA